MQFFSCAQVHHISQKAIGTYTVQMPGNIAVDAAGNDLTPRKIIAVIYMETSSKDLIVKNAQLDTSEYSVTQQQVNTLPYMAGINFKSNEKIIVNADKNNFLWRIELAPFPMIQRIMASRYKKSKSRNALILICGCNRCWRIVSLHH